jgi:DnaJ family protein C protein 13
MKAIIEEGSPETGQKMQMLALAEGAVPIHLVKALYIKSEDNRLLMQRQLSRHLISLWTADNDAAIELLQRILVSHCKNVVTIEKPEYE